MTVLRIGTRGSALATTQTALVAKMLRERGHEARLEIIVTRGDRERDRPVPLLGGKGLFTAELEQALLDGRIQLAVHSLKDLPTEDARGLVLAAVPPREDPRDALVARAGLGFGDLPPGAMIGTASLRRRALLRAQRPDLEFKALRGNVDTRIAKVDSGEMDAVVLAAAGLLRLGRAHRITGYLPILGAPAQGALAVQAAEANHAAREAAAAIHDPDTAACAGAERRLLHLLEGGCSVPVGAHAVLVEENEGPKRLHLRGVVASLDGDRLLRAEARGSDPDEVGRAVADALLAQGAKEILDACKP